MRPSYDHAVSIPASSPYTDLLEGVPVAREETAPPRAHTQASAFPTERVGWIAIGVVSLGAGAVLAQIARTMRDEEHERRERRARLLRRIEEEKRRERPEGQRRP